MGTDLEGEVGEVVFGEAIEHLRKSFDLLRRHRLSHQALDLRGNAQVTRPAPEKFTHLGVFVRRLHGWDDRVAHRLERLTLDLA